MTNSVNGHSVSEWAEIFNDVTTYGTAISNEACESICEAAGMSQEWAQADGETFENVLRAAAAKLGVELNI